MEQCSTINNSQDFLYKKIKKKIWIFSVFRSRLDPESDLLFPDPDPRILIKMIWIHNTENKHNFDLVWILQGKRKLVSLLFLCSDADEDTCAMPKDLRQNLTKARTKGAQVMPAESTPVRY